ALRELPETGMRTELIGRLIDELIEDNSRLSVELSPPTISHEGLVDALGWLRQYISQEHGLNIHLQATGDLTIHDPDLREVIFQMVRELLLNVARHAGVSEASLTLRREQDNLVIHVADEGAGFDPELVLASTDEETTFGIRTLRERVDIFGGSLDVDSSPGVWSDLEKSLYKTSLTTDYPARGRRAPRPLFRPVTDPAYTSGCLLFTFQRPDHLDAHLDELLARQHRHRAANANRHVLSED